MCAPGAVCCHVCCDALAVGRRRLTAACEHNTAAPQLPHAPVTCTHAARRAARPPPAAVRSLAPGGLNSALVESLYAADPGTSLARRSAGAFSMDGRGALPGAGAGVGVGGLAADGDPAAAGSANGPGRYSLQQIPASQRHSNAGGGRRASYDGVGGATLSGGMGGGGTGEATAGGGGIGSGVLARRCASEWSRWWWWWWRLPGSVGAGQARLRGRAAAPGSPCAAAWLRLRGAKVPLVYISSALGRATCHLPLCACAAPRSHPHPLSLQGADAAGRHAAARPRLRGRRRPGSGGRVQWWRRRRCNRDVHGHGRAASGVPDLQFI